MLQKMSFTIAILRLSVEKNPVHKQKNLATLTTDFTGEGKLR